MSALNFLDPVIDTLPHPPPSKQEKRGSCWRLRSGLVLVGAVLVASCSSGKMLAPSHEFGVQPNLVAPSTGLLPTVKPAKAIGWPEGKLPQAAEGLRVQAFARGLDHPRWLLALPNGDVLVAESQAPAKSGGFSGLKGWFARKLMVYAGAGGVSADRITLLRDTDGDGVADLKTVLLSELNSPFGMALQGGYLYVANTDALLRFPFSLGQLRIDQPSEHVVDLPAGELNHHWTKNVLARDDGSLLYVAVGSNSNIGENGLSAERDRAAILEVDAEKKTYRVYADGLRNPVGMDWHPVTDELWVAVNERDELGDQLVPDYITSIKEGGFYGWPWSYWGEVIDARVTPPNPQKVAVAIRPDYAVGAHTASLGLAFYHHTAMPQFNGGALVGQHGSWNRSERSGYKVVFVPFLNGAPVGQPIDVLTGFLSEQGDAFGRPAGLAVDPSGSILVADDAGNTVWRISSS